MRLTILSILIACSAAIFAAGCTASTPAAPQNITVPPAGSVSVTIHPDITHYTVLMSSAPGIGLSPVIAGQVPAGNLTYVWKADYGHFVGWSAPDYTIRELGTTVTGNVTKVYWSYLGENESASRPPVHITLTLIDPSGATLGSAEQTLGWDRNGTAVIG